MKAPLPRDEKERLEALRRYQILDTRAEGVFDDITMLAAHICGTPTALITLVDEKRQWVKSKLGSMAVEIPRDISFCSHAILQTDVLIVPDALADERFSTNPLVAGDPEIRFYAGAPLRTGDGHALGAVCVIDQVPRELSAEQKLALQALSRQVTNLLESRRVLMELWQNVARLKKTKEELTLRTAFFEAKVNSSRDGVLVVDGEGRKILQNERFNEMWDVPPAIVEEKNYEKQLEWRLGMLQEPEPYRDKVQYLYAHPDKTSDDEIQLRDGRVFDQHSSPVVGRGGHFYGRIWIFRDVTQRKRDEEQLKLSAQRLSQANQALQEVLDAATHFAIIAATPGGPITVFNRGAERMLGYTSEEIVGKQRPPLFHLESEITARARELTEELGRPVQGEDVFVEKARQGTPEEREWTYVRKDGSHLTVSLIVTARYDATGGIVGFLGMARDITADKKAEKKLADQALMLDQANDTIFIRDHEDRITYWNRGAQRLYGWSREEALGQVSHTLFRTQFPQPVEAINAQLRAEGSWQGELVHTCRDGSQVTVSSSWTLQPGDDNQTRCVIETSHDITARKRAEEHLKSSLLRLSVATEAMEAGIWDWDVRANVIEWDEKIHEIYARTAKGPVTYQDWADAVVPEDLPEAEAVMKRVVASKVNNSVDFRIRLPDGSIRHIHAAEGALLDDAGQVMRVIGVNIDVTERKRLEQQFLRSQRLESIGTLAGGIAHDLNNILAPIVMSIDLLKGMSDNPDSTSILETIEISAKRGAEIVGQVLSFARGLEGERIEVQLQPLLHELEKIISNTFPKDVRLQAAVGDRAWAVLGDPTQIRQVLLNLCVNARDAMPNGGLLTVRADNCVIDEQYAAMNPQARVGRFVNLSVTDTGRGIPPAIIGKIFEPFFTTKELGKGTGLGLSTVLAIAKSHEGFVNVYSEPGKGTTFKVCLPAMDTPAEALKKMTGKVSLCRGNGETVLVVDDEASIRAITARTLQASGWQVLTATDGADGVAVYLENQDAIAAVLTDMAMPVMDGSALIHALMRINPAVKIIAASGLDANGAVAEASREGVKHFLTKPYNAETLLKAVQDILSSG